MTKRRQTRKARQQTYPSTDHLLDLALLAIAARRLALALAKKLLRRRK
jgi:hypothetical protein